MCRSWLGLYHCCSPSLLGVSHLLRGDLFKWSRLSRWSWVELFYFSDVSRFSSIFAKVLIMVVHRCRSSLEWAASTMRLIVGFRWLMMVLAARWIVDFRWLMMVLAVIIEVSSNKGDSRAIIIYTYVWRKWCYYSIMRRKLHIIHLLWLWKQIVLIWRWWPICILLLLLEWRMLLIDELWWWWDYASSSFNFFNLAAGLCSHFDIVLFLRLIWDFNNITVIIIFRFDHFFLYLNAFYLFWNRIFWEIWISI